MRKQVSVLTAALLYSLISISQQPISFSLISSSRLGAYKEQVYKSLQLLEQVWNSDHFKREIRSAEYNLIHVKKDCATQGPSSADSVYEQLMRKPTIEFTLNIVTSKKTNKRKKREVYVEKQVLTVKE